jgi:putative transcriptional regulator
MRTTRRKTRRGSSKHSLNDTVREFITDLGQVQDVKETLRKFDALQYEQPKTYTARDIIAFREHKMRMSQAVFACVCNAKLSTVQKWERGVTKPTPPINRLFQLIEHNALNLIKR